MTQEGIKKCAVFCILTAGDQYLLLKRAKEPNKGKYVPVGGKIDRFETPNDAVIREVFEETSIQLDSVIYCGSLVETSPINYNWISFIYSMEIPFQSSPACDEGQLEWIHESQLKNLDTPATDWQIYQYIKNDRKFALDAVFDNEMKMVKMVEMLSGDIVV
jgi:8-oxo-dGTP diphosphatase